jgi:hypothetical protein
LVSLLKIVLIGITNMTVYSYEIIYNILRMNVLFNAPKSNRLTFRDENNLFETHVV